MAIPNVNFSQNSIFVRGILKKMQQVDRGFLNKPLLQSEVDKILSPDQIQPMVASVHLEMENGPVEQARVWALREVLLCLKKCPSNVSIESMMEPLLSKLEPVFEFIWKLHGSPEGNPSYGKDQIRKNPHLLLEICNSEGKNPIEVMIERGDLGKQKWSMNSQAKRVHQLEMLLLYLYTDVPKEQLCAGLDQIDKELFRVLCYLVWKLHGSPEGNPSYGEDRIRENPYLLLDIINSAGKNLIEVLIDECARKPQENRLSEFIQTHFSELFHIDKQNAVQISGKRSFVKICYQKLAKELLSKIRRPTSEETYFSTVRQLNPILDIVRFDEKLAFEIGKLIPQILGRFPVTKSIYDLLSQDHLFEMGKHFGLKGRRLPLIKGLSDERKAVLSWIYLSDLLIENCTIPWLQEFLEREELKLKFQDIPEFQENASKLKKTGMQMRVLYGYVHAVFEEKNVEIPLEFKSIFQELRQYPNLSLAISFTQLLCEAFFSDPEYATRCQALIKTKGKVIIYLIFPMILIAKWGFSSEGASQIKDVVVSMRQSFRNAKEVVLQTWLQALLVIDQSPLCSDRKCSLIQEACQDLKIANSNDEIEVLKKTKDLCERLRLIQALCSQDQAACLAREGSSNTTKKLQDLLMEKLQEDPFIDFKGIEDLSNRYLETFGVMRVPLAWKVYEERIQTLGGSLVQVQFQRFVTSVLNKTFPTERYRTDLSPHLAQLQEKCPEVFKKWQQPQPAVAIGPTDAASSKKEAINFQEFFKQKQGDGHFKLKDKDQLPQFSSFLELSLAEQPMVLAALKEKRSTSAAAEGPALEVEMLCMELCLTKESPKILLEALKKDLQVFPKLELINDIKGLIKGLEAAPAEKSLTVVDTDDWQDLFLSGTEVSNSCQRVDGDPYLNKCLLAYVMDGKNRMLAVKDASGKIVARSIFRLLLDKETNEPLLFQDRIYPYPCSNEHVLALNQHVEDRAKELGCPLITVNSDRKNLIDYSGTAVSLGSCCPYEYEDAAEGIMEDGKFEISRLKTVSLD